MNHDMSRKCSWFIMWVIGFNRKKYSTVGRDPGNGNRYPLGHEHGYKSASNYREMQVRALKMNGNLLRDGASILRPMRASPPPPSSAICTMLRSSTSVLRHSAPTAPRPLTFTFCSSCLARRAYCLHNLLLTKLHRSIKYVHSFTGLHRVGSRHLLLVVLRTFCKVETSWRTFSSLLFKNLHSDCAPHLVIPMCAWLLQLFPVFHLDLMLRSHSHRHLIQ